MVVRARKANVVPMLFQLLGGERLDVVDVAKTANNFRILDGTITISHWNNETQNEIWR